jgi:hypothetical protein
MGAGDEIGEPRPAVAERVVILIHLHPALESELAQTVDKQSALPLAGHLRQGGIAPSEDPVGLSLVSLKKSRQDGVRLGLGHPWADGHKAYRYVFPHGICL